MKKFSMVRKLVDEAIEVARKEAEQTGDRMGVNWADVRCTSIRHCVDEDGDEIFHLMISEASPDATEFRRIIHEYVRDGIMLLTSQIVDLEVETEW